MIDLLEAQILKNLDDNKSRHAIKIKNESITYKILFEKSLRIANLLKLNGITEQNIGIVGRREFSVYIGILGAIFAGCSYTPLSVDVLYSDP